LGRQFAFELLLYHKLRRQPWRTGAVGVCGGGAEAVVCDGGARVKPMSGGGGTRPHGRCAGEAHERRWRGRGGCGRACGCLWRQLGLGAKQQVCE
jgi:hypothetical protein